MRHRKKSTVFTSIVLALALTLGACDDADDDGDNGDTIDPGTDVTSTTMVDMTTTTLP